MSDILSFQLASDLHIEFYKNNINFKDFIIKKIELDYFL